VCAASSAHEIERTSGELASSDEHGRSPTKR
jgi:hypothetical protein